MALTLVTGPANAGKAQVVMDAVRRHVAHGEEPLLVVPTRADAEHYRRELAGEGAAMGVEVERFVGLLGEAVRRAGVGGQVLGELARERVLAAIAARCDAGGEEIVPAPGLVRALGEFVAELQVRRVKPARLSRALAKWAAAEARPASERSGRFVADLGRMFERYEALLRELGRVDQEQRAVRALDALRRTPALWGRRPVLFYGFDDLARLQLDAIETLGVVVDAEVTVSLAYEPGRTAFAGRAGTFHALAPLASEHRQLGPRAEYYAPGSRAALSHVERSLFEPDAARVNPGNAVRLLEGGGERAELELVACEIGRLLGDGMAPEEIAVVLRASPARADLLAEVFSSARIPHALQRRRPLADTATGRALIGVLRSVAPAVAAAAGPSAGGDGANGSGSARADGPRAGGGEVADLLAWLRAPGHLERPELADRLEARARRRGVRGAEQARLIWEQDHWPLERIDDLQRAQQRGASALIERARRELRWLFAAPRRGRASVLAEDELDEAKALAAAERALGELGELARLHPELAPSDAAGLALALEGLEVLSGEPAARGSVAVLDPLALRARRVRALFLCGMQEGVFPAPARPQPLLAEEERRRLAEISGLSLGEHEDALAAERYLLYAAVSRPRELLVLSWHVCGDDGMPQMPSLFVEDVCDLFEQSLRERRARRAMGAVGAPGIDAGGRSPALGRAPAVRMAPLRDQQLLREGSKVGPDGRTWSASSLEVWISCPVRWFVERELRPAALDPDPEPLTRGGLAHVALKDTLEALGRERGSARLTPGSLGRARELLAHALDEHSEEFPLSAAPERRAALRRRLRADLERYLEHAAGGDREASAVETALEPTHLELAFGFAADDEKGDGRELPAFDLGGGVMMRGRIDRVDVGEGGEAVVFDYKGANVSGAEKWIEHGDLQVALYMLAIEDLLGLRTVGGFYQPLSGGDLRARGVLDSDSGVHLDSVGADGRDRAEVRVLLGQALTAAREAAAAAGRGELSARPQTCAFRGGCMYPTVCGCER